MLDMLFVELPSKEFPRSALKNVDLPRFIRALQLKKGDTIPGRVFQVVVVITIIIPVLFFHEFLVTVSQQYV